jgi:lipopolysaccharide export system protein LptA
MNMRRLIFTLFAAVVFSSARAQVPQGTHLAGPTMALYRQTTEGRKMLDGTIHGSSVSNLNSQTALVTDFELKNFKNGDAKQVEVIAQAPECAVEISTGRLWNAGHVQVFTPTTNLFVQGEGFLFVQSNHFLVISNDVETRVVKSLVKSHGPASPVTNPPDAGRVLIYATEGRFNLDSNVVDYTDHVHLIDPQLDMTCDLLTIRFNSNGVVESMLARQHVVLTTTNNGRATGDIGYYYVTNDDQMMRLTHNAYWRNGDEEAKADEFTYDSNRHVLSGTKVKVRWPNSSAGPGMTTGGPAPLQVGTNGFRELYADYAVMQFPPTNGPAERMMAHGNVLIVNQADQNSAVAEQAVYERAADSIELTGHPVWWNTNMEVKAETLTADLGAKTYHARTGAHFKMHLGTASGTPSPSVPGHSSNQWLFISSGDIEYLTNQATFYRDVQARLVDNERMQDKLDCAVLTLNLTNNKVESAFARESVRGETAPDQAGVFKTISCERLNAYCSPVTGRMESLDAHTNVVIEQKGNGPNAPSNALAADTVTAQFSPVTNRIEQAVAEQNVVFDQRKGGNTTHATADHAVYNSGTNDEVRLTGHPLAHDFRYIITNADFLVWKPKTNIFQAGGHYQIIPIKRPAAEKLTKS